MLEAIKKGARYKEAETLERAGRYEEAARWYETIARDIKDETLLDKARELRDKARSFQVKTTYVNVNELISQAKKGGLVAAYDCPNCGGKLSIDGSTKPESISKCKYCGSPIDVVKLPELLKAALS